jgi:ribonuclease HII
MKLTEKMIERTKKIVEYDRNIAKEYSIFCGIDEAGRGPLAGPVVVASCVMPLEEDKILFGVYDSKKVTEKQRTELYEKIKQTAISFSIQEVDEKTIDKINILEATKLGMKNAIENLQIKLDLALVDAVKNIDSDVDQIAIIKGDATSYSIACASILAKVYRDNLMLELDKKYPQYGFAKHKGYGTAEHISALKKYGASPIHRKTFIKNFVEE